MSNSEQNLSAVPTPEIEPAEAKLAYNTPEFTDLGSVEQLTLGGTNSGSELFGSLASL